MLTFRPPLVLACPPPVARRPAPRRRWPASPASWALAGLAASRVARPAAAESAAATPQQALQELLGTVPVRSGVAVLLIPRRFAAEADALAKQASQALEGVDVVACVSGGNGLQLGTLEMPGARALTLGAETLDTDLPLASTERCEIRLEPSKRLGKFKLEGKKWPVSSRKRP